jgi:hypothetical protein
MATLLDADIMGLLSPIITFLFILVVTYAMMDKFELMGKNRAIHGAIAFCVAFLFLFSRAAVGIIQVVTPWFMVLAILGLFIISFFIFIGVKPENMTKAVERPEVYWPLLIIILIFLFVSIAQVFKATADVDDTISEGEGTSAGLNAIVNPKVLGAVILLVIAAMSIRLITENVTIKD